MKILDEHVFAVGVICCFFGLGGYLLLPYLAVTSMQSNSVPSTQPQIQEQTQTPSQTQEQPQQTSTSSQKPGCLNQVGVSNCTQILLQYESRNIQELITFAVGILTLITILMTMPREISKIMESDIKITCYILVIAGIAFVFNVFLSSIIAHFIVGKILWALLWCDLDKLSPCSVCKDQKDQTEQSCKDVDKGGEQKKSKDLSCCSNANSCSVLSKCVVEYLKQCYCCIPKKKPECMQSLKDLGLVIAKKIGETGISEQTIAASIAIAIVIAILYLPYSHPLIKDFVNVDALTGIGLLILLLLIVLTTLVLLCILLKCSPWRCLKILFSIFIRGDVKELLTSLCSVEISCIAAWIAMACTAIILIPLLIVVN